jgi:hypothetical protein
MVVNASRSLVFLKPLGGLQSCFSVKLIHYLFSYLFHVVFLILYSVHHLYLYFLPERSCFVMYLSIYYGSAVLSLDLFRFFSFLILYTAGLLGRGISPPQGRYLHTEQHKHRINAHKHPCLERDSNLLPSIRPSEDSSCLNPSGHCDRLYDVLQIEIWILGMIFTLLSAFLLNRVSWFMYTASRYNIINLLISIVQVMRVHFKNEVV